MLVVFIYFHSGLKTNVNQTKENSKLLDTINEQLSIVEKSMELRYAEIQKIEEAKKSQAEAEGQKQLEEQKKAEEVAVPKNWELIESSLSKEQEAKLLNILAKLLIKDGKLDLNKCQSEFNEAIPVKHSDWHIVYSKNLEYAVSAKDPYLLVGSTGKFTFLSFIRKTSNAGPDYSRMQAQQFMYTSDWAVLSCSGLNGNEQANATALICIAISRTSLENAVKEMRDKAAIYFGGTWNVIAASEINTCEDEDSKRVFSVRANGNKIVLFG